LLQQIVTHMVSVAFFADIKRQSGDPYGKSELAGAKANSRREPEVEDFTRNIVEKRVFASADSQRSLRQM
jgi:hypothetical protein